MSDKIDESVHHSKRKFFYDSAIVNILVFFSIWFQLHILVVIQKQVSIFELLCHFQSSTVAKVVPSHPILVVIQKQVCVFQLFYTSGQMRVS